MYNLPLEKEGMHDSFFSKTLIPFTHGCFLGSLHDCNWLSSSEVNENVKSLDKQKSSQHVS